jgi:5-methylcytosine-specific restriction endonuclease McrBC regulatory subunit McrC
MHLLCRFFLDNLGPAWRKGKDIFTSFNLLDMSTLFQDFVFRWLEKHSQYVVDKEAIRLNSSDPGFDFTPDIKLKDRPEKVMAVLDTKYKDGRPQADDIHQAVAYAESLGLSKAFLVYPSQTSSGFWVKVGDVCIQSLVFDVSSPSMGGNKFLMDLEAALA